MLANHLGTNSTVRSLVEPPLERVWETGPAELGWAPNGKRRDREVYGKSRNAMGEEFFSEAEVPLEGRNVLPRNESVIGIR
jgi:hypothetical protein